MNQKQLESSIKLRLWDFVLKHRLSQAKYSVEQICLLPPSYYFYINYRNSIHQKKKDYVGKFEEVKKFLQSKVALRDHQIQKDIADGKKMAIEADILKVTTPVQVDTAELLSLLSSLFKDTFHLPLAFGSGELSIPNSWQPVAAAVRQAVLTCKKEKPFLEIYLNKLQESIRREEPKILLDRFQHCPLTQAIFVAANLKQNLESFLKVMATISRLFNLPYVIPANFQGQTGRLQPSLYWDVQGKPMSHSSLVVGHLFNWCHLLQANRVTKFKVNFVKNGFVILFNPGSRHYL